MTATFWVRSADKLLYAFNTPELRPDRWTTKIGPRDATWPDTTWVQVTDPDAPEDIDGKVCEPILTFAGQNVAVAGYNPTGEQSPA